MNTMSDAVSVAAPEVKIASAWGAVAVTSWTDFASMIAAIYTMALFGEWLWKKFFRPMAESRGWLRRIKRRKNDDGGSL